MLRSFLVLMCFWSVSLSAHAEQNWNIRTAPISDALGIYNLELDYRIGEKFTLGPALYHFDYELSGVSYNSTSAGIRGNYYFRSVNEGGWLLGLSALYGTFTVSQTRSTDSRLFQADVSTRVYSLLLSYQAVWENFNITTGAGLAYFSLPSTVVAEQGGSSLSIDTSFLSGTVPTVELMLGWRF